MFNCFKKILKIVTEHPFVNIVVALVLLYSGVSETLHEFKEMQEFKVGVHHGVIFFAVLHLLKSLHEVIEGLEYVSKVKGEVSE